MKRFDRPQFILPGLVVAIGAIAYLSCSGDGCETTKDVGGGFMLAGLVALLIAFGAEFLEPR